MRKRYLVGLLMALLAGFVFLKRKPATAAVENVSTETMPVEARSAASAVSPVPAEPAKEVKRQEPAKAGSPEETAQKKMHVLDEIFSSRNDNDPRLDSEFKNLSQEEKQMLEQKYRLQPKENLNERGTLAFLVGREIRNTDDLEFIKSVALDKPCNDFANCEHMGQGARDSHEGIDELTLAYPQVVALKAVERILNTTKDAQLHRRAQEIISDASKSSNGIVKNLAEDIQAGAEGSNRL